MILQPLAISGCYLLRVDRHEDARGDFLKLFQGSTLASHALEARFAESFVSTSNAGVIRGMHFQRPPKDHAKLVSCLSGCARDGFTDLRRGSPTFGVSVSVMLRAEDPAVLYLPRGIAHGFAAHRDGTAMWYLVSSEHDPALDAGIHADSVGIDWWEDGPGVTTAIMSARDQALPAMADYLPRSDFGIA
ncbi:dTDP-4-dehydrorhamnose 3,5-epimerase [Cupriavidus sp. U2]|uniref:dTDP-4-dehydrorhamnose 3,5-epimerase family protein n=1 Tax=Cupriavidus sp. U2 TaxID=2920269 RepID=UPI00129D2B02|nr:dTDP-4-dehydrorhamnose 3,5-epimerase family protein [Cupriavidus sp. U2]KAI3590825.1 dTDP-4-dehydrorhamnose 3,5-epimerase [Cupriavidus sp. U2]